MSTGAGERKWIQIEFICSRQREEREREAAGVARLCPGLQDKKLFEFHFLYNDSQTDSQADLRSATALT